MGWRQTLADWIAPKAAEAVKEVEAVADAAKEKIVVAVQTQAPGMSRRLVLFLLTLALLFLSVGGYAIYWRFFRQVKPLAALVPVQTQGGEKYPGYAAPTVKGLPKVPQRTTTRPVQSTPVAELPKKEQGYAPVVAPVTGKDNVTRTEPELLTSSVVPGSRGDTEIRTWLNPDGSAQNVLTPQREAFFGWPWKDGNWKRVEIEGRYGLVGATQAKGTARWLPLRVGDLHGGIEGSVAAERDGVIRGEGVLMFRFEPFRSQYR